MEELKEFYNNISCTVEDDAGFAAIIASSWRMNP